MTKERVVDFSRLVQESRQLNARIRSAGHSSSFIPSLQRGLAQVEELSSRLAAKVAAYSSQGNKATMFLASRSFDIAGLEEDIRRVNGISTANGHIVTGGTVPLSTSAIDPDLEMFLQNEMDAAIMGTLDCMDNHAIKEAEAFLNKRYTELWGELCKELCESTTILSSVPFKIESRATVGPKVVAYAKVVRALNEARLKGSSLSFSKVVEKELRSMEGSDPKNEMLIDCWRVLQFIFEETDAYDEEDAHVFQAPSPINNDLRAAYLADPNTTNSLPWKKQLVQGGRKFLEDLYLRFIDRTLAQYPRDALLGGKPSKIERIRAFCDIKLKRLTLPEVADIEQSGSLALWMIIYHLVRCGLLEEALSFAFSHEITLQRTDPHFVSYLKAFVTSPTHQLSSTIISQLRLEYNKLMASKKTIDPYRIALLKMIGRCDLSRKSVGSVIQTSEDYIWLQYWLIEDVTNDDVDAAYTLADLQRIVCDYGPRHFDPKNNNPWHYFEILCLVGLFERGLEYLYQTGQLADAVHFATTMLINGFLKLTKPCDHLFVKEVSATNRRGNLAVNFASLVTTFIRIHEDVTDAINYILLLTIHNDAAYNKMALDTLRDLVLSSGDLGSLLGDVRPDGVIRPGLLAQYARLLGDGATTTASKFIENLTAAAADKCDAEGRFKESLQLYNLAGRYGRVLEVLNWRMSRSFVASYSPLNCDEIRRTAEAILNYYANQNHIAATLSPVSRSTCVMLIQLLQLRRLYEDSQWNLALDTLISLKTLLPLDGSISSIASGADRVRELPDSLSLLLPELLLMAMTVITKRAEELSAYIGIDAGRAQQTEILKKMARTLMTFVGMLRLRIPQETYAQLARMQVSLDL